MTRSPIAAWWTGSFDSRNLGGFGRIETLLRGTGWWHRIESIPLLVKETKASKMIPSGMNRVVSACHHVFDVVGSFLVEVISGWGWLCIMIGKPPMISTDNPFHHRVYRSIWERGNEVNNLWFFSKTQMLTLLKTRKVEMMPKEWLSCIVSGNLRWFLRFYLSEFATWKLDQFIRHEQDSK